MKLSATQQLTISCLADYMGEPTQVRQEIRRQPGGFWVIGNIPKHVFYAGTTTVRALETAGILMPKYMQQAGRGRSFVSVYCTTELGQKLLNEHLEKAKEQK